MKKLVLLLITLISLTNMSYASFPIVENFEVKEIQMLDDEPLKYGSLFAVLSVLLSLLSLIFIFLFIGSGMMHNGNPFPYLLLSIVSIISTILSGMEAKRRGLRRSNSFIGISILVIALLLIRYLVFV